VRAALSFASWHDFYYAAWQQPWALLVAPFAFVVFRLVAAPPGPGAIPDARPFVIAWSWVFALETMLDPVATGPLAKAIGSEGASTALGLAFVLLGDFRIWWPVFRLADPRRSLLPALLATGAVPVFAWLTTLGLGAAFGALPGQALWLVHEVGFVALAAFVSRRSADRLVRALLAFAAVYYALWAASDVLILAGVDEGWLLRCVPNQLYYGLTVPFVWWRFFSPSYAASSTSTQASR
jgi:hypothetical protein